MSNPWQQIFESHREQIEENYIAEKYGQHKSDEAQETQALYDLRNKLKNMGKDAVVAYLKRSKMSPERKARLAKELSISIAENFNGDDIQEVAPPGAKYERMVKHIKAGYKKGGLTKKEKSIAYATAWKERNKEKTNEEFESLQEESKILVRVTKEDGSVFQKKIPASQLADYRSRYKAVVVVGGSEQSRTGVGTKSEEYVNEADKKKTHRWWDDDGDGIGYEKGEVSGKFKKKKKVKEQLSDWRSENPELFEATKAQKSVEGKGPHASYDNQEGDKKKRKKKSSESECDCSHEVKEAAEVLAQELGGELVDIHEYAKAAASVIKAFVRPKPLAVPRIVPFIRPVKPTLVPAPKPGKPVPAPKPGKPVPAPAPTPGKPVPAPKPGKPVRQPKPEKAPERTAKPSKSLAPATDTIVSLDSQTGAVTSAASRQIPKTGAPSGTGGGIDAPTGGAGPGGGPGGGGIPLKCPEWMKKRGLCGLSAKLRDPVPQAKQFKV